MSDVPSPERDIARLPRVRWSMKSLEERLAEADKLRGVVSDRELKEIKEAIRDSAEDFGEAGEIVIEPPPEAPLDEQLTIADIQRTVASRLAVPRDAIIGRRRKARVVRARQVAMYLCRILTRNSLPGIGRRFGGRHHTTVMHAVWKIEVLIEVDREMAREIRELIVALRPD